MREEIIMKKLLSVMLAVAMVFTLGTTASPVKAAEKSVLYKITPVEGYNETIGKYIEFTETGELYSFGDWQEYMKLDSKTSFTSHGVTVTAVDLTKVEKVKAKTLQRGMYLVNYEIKPGKYKIVGSGAAIMMSDTTIDRNDDFIQSTAVIADKGNPQYITVKKGQFALYLVGKVTATRVK